MLSPSPKKGRKEKWVEVLKDENAYFVVGFAEPLVSDLFAHIEALEERLRKAGDNMKKAHEHLTDGIEKSTEHQPCFFASIRANELIAEALAELSPSDQ